MARAAQDGSGVVAIDIKIDDLITMTKEVNIGKEGYAFILSKNKKPLPTVMKKPARRYRENGLIHYSAGKRRL